MRYLKLMLVIIGLAATLCAADLYVGTWKMNPAKSKFKAGAPSKEQTVVIAETGGDLDVKVTGTAADGSRISIHYTVPSAGGTGKLIESSSYDGVSAKRMAANEREVSYLKGGKAVYTTHSKVAADGKSLSVSAKGLNPQGKAIEGDIVYERQ